ncbi:thiamine pyrophosphate-binding protein [Paracidovorax oryzae]|uniref:thiamine pyrophosphate-binding protein n=1 Tax=Paracidovorax oryzae TaxID=862720 RepID=UPI00192B07FD
MIAGGGVHASRAAGLLTTLCDRIQPLHVSSLSGKGSVPETRPYAAGVLNPLGSEAAIQLVKEADLLIWCGSKASQNTAMNWTLPLAGQANITIDIDPTEHGRTFQPTVALCGDIGATLEVLNAMVDAAPQPDWLERIAAVKAEKQARLDAEKASTQLPIIPPAVMAGIASRLGPQDVVISDASFSAGWIAQYIPATEVGRRFIYARGQGGLGYASPAAIGAAAAAPGGARAGDRARGAEVRSAGGQGHHGRHVARHDQPDPGGLRRQRADQPDRGPGGGARGPALRHVPARSLPARGVHRGAALLQRRGRDPGQHAARDAQRREVLQPGLPQQQHHAGPVVGRQRVRQFDGRRGRRRFQRAARQPGDHRHRRREGRPLPGSREQPARHPGRGHAPPHGPAVRAGPHSGRAVVNEPRRIALSVISEKKRST